GRVDDDPDPAVVPLEAQLEHRQARLQRDREAIVLRKHGSPPRGELLLREKQQRHVLQAPGFGLCKSGEERQARAHAAPHALVERVLLEHALALPVAQPAHSLRPGGFAKSHASYNTAWSRWSSSIRSRAPRRGSRSRRALQAKAAR